MFFFFLDLDFQQVFHLTFMWSVKCKRMKGISLRLDAWR